MRCAVFTAIAIYGAATNRESHWYFAVSVLAAIAMFIVAAGWAWLDEYRKAEAEKIRADNLAIKIDEIEQAKPKIKLREPSAIFTESVRQSYGNNMFGDVPFLKANFVNDPPRPYPSAVAKGVLATIDYYDSSDNRHLLSIDGRWADSDQPSALNPLSSRVHLLSTNFGIGQSHSLDIAYLDCKTRECFAWNNDNYNYFLFRCEAHRLSGQTFKAIVRLRGEWVDERFEIYFSVSDGDLIVLPYQAAS